MPKIFNLLFVVVMLFTNACKKNKTTDDCSPNSAIARTILNKPATIFKQPNGIFYIVEQGTIDSKLIPCNLPSEFKVDQMQVVISGEVKTSGQPASAPCCTNNFYILKITK